MPFCSRCGKQIEEGQFCDCSTSAQSSTSGNTSGAQGFWALIRKRIGLGEQEKNTGNKYERNMKIVPDCISPSENEVPVRQYNIAVLRNLLRFERAEGRLQITNKRVILRAAGRSLGGRTIMQQEFSINEIAGFKTINNYRFNGFYLVLGFLIFVLAGFLGFAISAAGYVLGEIPRTIGPILGIGGLLPFFLLDRKILLKLVCLGLSGGYFAFIYLNSKNVTTFDGCFILLAILLTIFCLGLFSFKPNLVIAVNDKGSSEAPISLFRARGFFHIFQDSSSPAAGFSEVTPTPETENAIREIGAIINDIKVLGDLGLQKWINKI
jgi:hypothetical protein